MGLMTSEISSKQLVPLCRQMATSYDAGLPIIRTLELMSENAKDRRTKEVFLNMAQDARSGATLGEAARKQQKYLPRFFIELLHSGEMGGRLDVMLKDLAEYYEDRLSMQRKVAGAMVLPGIELVGAWFLGTFSLGLIGQINLESTGAFNLSKYFQEYIQFQGIAMLVALGVFILIVLLSRFGVFKVSWGFLLHFMWPFNAVSKKFSLARFFRSFSLLVGSGMNIQSCIGNAAAISGNPYVEKDLKTAIPRVAQGQTLVEAFRPCKSLTPVARDMLAVGEQSGNLEASLHKVAEYHLEEGRHALTVASKVMGTLIVLGVACIVGYVVISFYMKYFSMLNSLL